MAAERLISHPVGALAGFLISSVHFLVIYVFAALACARRFGDFQVLGLNVVMLVTGAVTLLALIATAAILVMAWRQRGSRDGARAEADSQCFLRWMTLAVAAMSIVTIVWNGIPIVMVPACQ